MLPIILPNSDPSPAEQGCISPIFTWRLAVGVTLSSTAPNQPINAKLGTETSFRTNMRNQLSKLIFNG